jgi:PPOX class probable F420-dependent enzyme
VILHSAIDQKPKRDGDPLQLARVRDLRARPQATVLVDRWSEDWDQLAWARLDCRAEVLPADGRADVPTRPDSARARAIAALRAKYPQYRAQSLEERPLIRLTCSVAASWGAIEEEM